MARQALGRGISALLGDDKQTTGDVASIEIDIDLVEPNPQQPRTRFAEQGLEELTQSIRANGILQPIVVRKVAGRYQIVAGERRWRAAQRAELRRIPAVTKEVSDEKMLELALIENIQRYDLNPIEEAKAYRKLIDSVGLTQDETAERVGKERSLIATSVRLLKLPSEIQRAVEDGQLTAGHGRALLMSDDPSVQREAANAAIDNQWSVKETINAVKRLGTAKPKKAAKNQLLELDANVKAAEVKLKRALNTNVKIRPARKGSGGKIEIEYYGTDDLDRIYQVLIKQ